MTKDNKPKSIPLDYSLETPEERVLLVNKIIDQAPPHQLTTRYKEILANYIIFAQEKKERKAKKILTEGRLSTVNKRETSYEALVDKLENKEDGLFHLIREDKNLLLSPKKLITQEERETIPFLSSLIEEIEKVDALAKAAIGTGKDAYTLKKMVIEMRKDQYVIRNSANQPRQARSLVKILAHTPLPETIYVDEYGQVRSTGLVNLYDEVHVSSLLRNYSTLKQEVWEDLTSDMHFLLLDLEEVAFQALYEDYPILFDILVYKIDGKSNEEIHRLLDSQFGTTYSLEYISSLWSNKIPRLIAETAQNNWLHYHYFNEAYGNWKTCGRCGDTKLAHERFYSRNSSSPDGFYSICKRCRNAKKQ